MEQAEQVWVAALAVRRQGWEPWAPSAQQVLASQLLMAPVWRQALLVQRPRLRRERVPQPWEEQPPAPPWVQSARVKQPSEQPSWEGMVFLARSGPALEVLSAPQPYPASLQPPEEMPEATVQISPQLRWALPAWEPAQPLPELGSQLRCVKQRHRSWERQWRLLACADGFPSGVI